MLSEVYLWIKVLHILSFISWMAGLFYLPRIFVYHAEKGANNIDMSDTFKIMENKLFKYIMTPAMIGTWLFGAILTVTPSVIDLYDDIWFYVKMLMVITLTIYHLWCGRIIKKFSMNEIEFSGKFFRIMNEVPTIGLIIIIVMVIIKPF